MIMSTNRRLFYIWCVLTGGMLLISMLPASSSIYQAVAVFDSHRWAHFFVYATVAAIPITSWRRRFGVLFALALAMLGIFFEFLQTTIPGPIVRPQNVLADLFGVGAGILFGLNIRMMRTSAKSGANAAHGPSRTPVR
jgi:VanZ family protein